MTDPSQRQDYTRSEKIAGRSLAIVADIVELIDVPVPGRALASRLVQEAIERRRATAREVLMAEIAKAEVDSDPSAIEQVDEFVAISIRYLRAAEEGARARNLRLLAKMFAQQLRGGVLSGDDFAQKVAAVEGLTDADINLLAMWFASPIDPRASLFDVCQAKGLPEGELHNVHTSAASLLRTGLVEPLSAYGGMGYRLTPLGLALREDLAADDLANGSA